MKIREVIKSGLAYGLFTATTMVVPAAIIGAVYGVVEIIHNVKERKNGKHDTIILKANDYKEVK